MQDSNSHVRADIFICGFGQYDRLICSPVLLNNTVTYMGSFQISVYFFKPPQNTVSLTQTLIFLSYFVFSHKYGLNSVN